MCTEAQKSFIKTFLTCLITDMIELKCNQPQLHDFSKLFN